MKTIPKKHEKLARALCYNSIRSHTNFSDAELVKRTNMYWDEFLEEAQSLIQEMNLIDDQLDLDRFVHLPKMRRKNE